MKLLQYQESVQGIPTSLAPERTTPDKWQPNTNIPQSNWQKAALYSAAALMPFFTMNLTPAQRIEQPKTFAPQSVVITVQRTTQYQALAYPVAGFSPKERITVDKWFKEAERPVWKVPNDNRTNGLLVFHPRPIVTVETITADKWHPLPNQPRFDVQRNQYLYPSLFLSTNQNFAITVPGAASYGIVFTQNFQYQSLAKPPQQTQAETVTLDKYAPNTEIPPRDVKRQQYLYPTSVIDANQLAQEEAVSSDRWQPAPNQPLFDFKRQQYTYPVSVIDNRQLTQGERITVDKWQPETNKPLFDVKRWQYTYPFLFFHPEPQEVTQFESPSEFARNVDKVYDRARTQYLYPSFTIDGKLLASEEAVSFDRWNFNQSIPRFDIPRNQYLYQSSFFYPEPKEATEFEDLLFQQDVLVRGVPRLQYLYPHLSVDPTALTQKERFTPDKWQPETNKPLFDVKRLQYTYPALFFGPFPIANPPGFIAPSIQQTLVPFFPIKHGEYLYSVFVTDSKHLLDRETITVDKWFIATGQPLKTKQGITFDNHLKPFVVSENVTLDKWFSAISQPQRKQVLLPTDQLTTLFVRENITLDKWLSDAGLPQSVRNSQYLHFGYVSGNNVITITPFEYWHNPTNQPIFAPHSHYYIPYDFELLHRLSTFWTDKLSPRGTSTSDKFSTRNTSYDDKLSPRGTSFDDKYSGRGSSFSDKYSQRASGWQDKYPRT